MFNAHLHWDIFCNPSIVRCSKYSCHTWLDREPVSLNWSVCIYVSVIWSLDCWNFVIRIHFPSSQTLFSMILMMFQWASHVDPVLLVNLYLWNELLLWMKTSVNSETKKECHLIQMWPDKMWKMSDSKNAAHLKCPNENDIWKEASRQE